MECLNKNCSNKAYWPSFHRRKLDWWQVFRNRSCTSTELVTTNFLVSTRWSPAHYDWQVREFLNVNFPKRCIGRRGFIEWPTCCPNLSQLDAFLWGYLKLCVYVYSDQHSCMIWDKELLMNVNQYVEKSCKKELTNLLIGLHIVIWNDLYLIFFHWPKVLFLILTFGTYELGITSLLESAKI